MRWRQRGYESGDLRWRLRASAVRRPALWVCGCVGVWVCVCVRSSASVRTEPVNRAVQVLAAVALLWLGEVASLEAGRRRGALDADVVRFLAQRGLSPPAMDIDQVERTKRHYDAHAKTPAGSRKDALRQREQVCAACARACAPPRAEVMGVDSMNSMSAVKHRVLPSSSSGSTTMSSASSSTAILAGRAGCSISAAAAAVCASAVQPTAHTLARTRAHACAIAHVASADSFVLQVTCRSGRTPKCGKWWALIYRQRRLTRQSAATAS